MLKQGSIRNNLARRCAMTLCWDHAGLSLPVPSITSWRAEIDGKRFSGMNEIDGSFWAISLKAGSASG
jgi:hypothetical protein